MASHTTQSDSRRRRVLFVAWFLNDQRHWLGDDLDPDRYECGYVGMRVSVDLTTRRTGPKKWVIYFLLAAKARWHLLWNRYDLVVSAFPQVGFAMALLKRFTFERTPHVIWYFNCGHEYRWLRRLLARFAFRSIKRFIVYTERERQVYSEVFALPRDRFRFTYLTGAELDRGDYAGARERYGLDAKYVASLGSSSRDFATLFGAADGLGVQVVVVTHRYCLEGLEVPSFVKVMETIPQEGYLRIIAEADVVAITVDNRETASGQMTLIQAMSLGVPVVATRCIGTEDYIDDGATGIFVEMADVEDLRRALASLLDDRDARQRMTDRALEFARRNFFDSAGSRVLDELYDEMAAIGEISPGGN